MALRERPGGRDGALRLRESKNHEKAENVTSEGPRRPAAGWASTIAFFNLNPRGRRAPWHASGSAAPDGRSSGAGSEPAAAWGDASS